MSARVRSAASSSAKSREGESMRVRGTTAASRLTRTWVVVKRAVRPAQGREWAEVRESRRRRRKEVFPGRASGAALAGSRHSPPRLPATSSVNGGRRLMVASSKHITT